LKQPSWTEKKTAKNESSKFPIQPFNPKSQVALCAWHHPTAAQLLIQRSFHAVMKAGFILVTQRHMTFKNAAHFCHDPNKQQIQRKRMQPCFMHDLSTAFAVPSMPNATT
jgi:hypothetical protein